MLDSVGTSGNFVYKTSKKVHILVISMCVVLTQIEWGSIGLCNMSLGKVRLLYYLSNSRFPNQGVVSPRQAEPQINFKLTLN